MKRGRFKRPLEPPLAPRSCVSISRRPPSTAQLQVFIKNKDVVYDDAFIIAKHNFINVFSVSSLLQRSSFPLMRTAPEWWHTPVVDSSKKFPRQKPLVPTCHLENTLFQFSSSTLSGADYKECWSFRHCCCRGHSYWGTIDKIPSLAISSFQGDWPCPCSERN